MTPRPAVAFAAALALAACSPAAQRTLPGDVVAGPGLPGASVDGIYAGPPHDQTCCWAQPDAVPRVRKDGPATDLALQFWLPDIPPFEHDEQGFTVTVPGRRPYTRCCFGPGMHMLLVPLPPELRDRTGTFPVRISARRGFVPSKAGLGPDQRTLAYVLVSVRFRSLWSGRF